MHSSAYSPKTILPDAYRLSTSKSYYVYNDIHKTREIQMRREDEGTPKVVTLVEDRAGKQHDIDELKVHRESSSLVDQMRKWFSIQKSRETKIVRETAPKMNTERNRDHTTTSTDDQRKLPEQLDATSLENDIISRGKSHTSLSDDVEYHDNQSHKGTARKERTRVFRESLRKNSSDDQREISDTTTYRSLDRGNIRHRIRELKKLKRNKRHITVSVYCNVIKYGSRLE